jgi:hypothetical protein
MLVWRIIAIFGYITKLKGGKKKTLADSQFLVTRFGFLLSKNGHPRVRPTCKAFNAVAALCFALLCVFSFCGLCLLDSTLCPRI